MSAEPRQLLPIRSRYRGPAFRAIEAILREDPVLAAQVKTWRSREGFADDMQFPALDMMPMVSLSPLPNPSTVLAIDEMRVNFAVSVQLFVPGTCVDDILALWEAVEDAIVRTNPFRGTTVGQYLCSVLSPAPTGVQRLIPSAPGFFGFDPTRPNNESAWQEGAGTLVCFLSRPA